jgi:hypothetical protein
VHARVESTAAQPTQAREGQRRCKAQPPEQLEGEEAHPRIISSTRCTALRCITSRSWLSSSSHLLLALLIHIRVGGLLTGEDVAGLLTGEEHPHKLIAESSHLLVLQRLYMRTMCKRSSMRARDSRISSRAIHARMRAHAASGSMQLRRSSSAGTLTIRAVQRLSICERRFLPQLA